MEAILIDAGNFCGLGDGRTIGMGRFNVENFKIIKEKVKAAKKKTT